MRILEFPLNRKINRKFLLLERPNFNVGLYSLH